MADQGAHSKSKASRRRPKPQTSCMNCRAKKLKCDHGQPCKNCTKLPPGSCVYATRTETSGLLKRASSKQKQNEQRAGNLQERIKNIEQAIASLAEQSASTGNEEGQQKRANVELKSQHDNSAIDDASPSLTTDDPEVHFVSPSHWESILKDIAAIKDELKLDEGGGIDDDVDDEAELQTSPQLLFGSNRYISRDELILSMPSRDVFQTLFTSYTEESDLPPLLAILHMPTFAERCDEFWQNPETVSLAWLSLLFSVMSLSLQFTASTGKKIEGVSQPKALASVYTSRAAQCLMASDYGKPTAYTIEAMIFYMACEHYWIEDSHFRGTLLFSLVVRLALRLGYHRDPQNFASLSVLESEMRRRIWYFMIGLDLQLSHKCGLPCALEYRCSDVQPPLNVPDEDLHADMHEMPVARPEAEETGAGCLVYEAQLLMLFNRVVDKINAPKASSYDETLELEKEFMAKAANKPTWFQTSLRDQSARSSLHKLNRWVDADLILQRARMIMHRRYLMPAHTNARYIHSREACLDAAEKVLRHQYMLYEASENYDGSTTSNWRYLSLSGHDFILAATLIFIDLDRILKDQRGRKNGRLAWSDAEQRRLELLNSSQHVWAYFDEIGPGARKAAKLIRAMNKSLERSWKSTMLSPTVANTSTHQHDPLSIGHVVPILDTEPQNDSLVCHHDNIQPIQSGAFPNWIATDDFIGVAPFNNVFQGVLDNSIEQMDWAAWDAEFQQNVPDFR